MLDVGTSHGSRRTGPRSQKPWTPRTRWPKVGPGARRCQVAPKTVHEKGKQQPFCNFSREFSSWFANIPTWGFHSVSQPRQTQHFGEAGAIGNEKKSSAGPKKMHFERESHPPSIPLLQASQAPNTPSLANTGSSPSPKSTRQEEVGAHARNLCYFQSMFPSMFQYFTAILWFVIFPVVHQQCPTDFLCLSMNCPTVFHLLSSNVQLFPPLFAIFCAFFISDFLRLFNIFRYFF